MKRSTIVTTSKIGTIVILLFQIIRNFQIWIEVLKSLKVNMIKLQTKEIR